MSIKHDPNFIGITKKSEFIKTIRYYLDDALKDKDPETYLRVILDNTHKAPIYTHDMPHKVEMLYSMPDEELKIAVKVCIALHIGGAAIFNPFNDLSWARRERELLHTKSKVVV